MGEGVALAADMARARRLDRALLAAAIGLVVWALWGYTARAVQFTASFDGFPADGAFQIFNPLRRMAAGQLPGRDFQYFHGFGVPWLFAPLFLALGGDLRASELSRYLVCNGTFLVTAAVFVRAAGARWRTALPVAVLFAVLAPRLRMGNLVDPANSVFALRTAGPVLVAALLLAQTRRYAAADPRRAALVIGAAAGAALGVSFAVGTEQALAALAALALVAVMLPPFAGGARPRLLLAGTAIAVFVTVVLLLATVLTLGHPAAPLGYALVDVPTDQFWYFGVPPNLFVDDFRKLLNPRILRQVGPALLLLPVVVVLRRRSTLDRGTAFAFSFLLAYGLASTASLLAILELKYGEACLRAGVLSALALGMRLAAPRLAAAPAVLASPLRAAPAAVAALACALVGFDIPRDRLSPGKVHGGVALGVQLGESWAAAKQVDDGVLGTGPLPPGSVWASYTGLAEAERGYFLPAEDYVIHALGRDASRRYAETFERVRPTFVRLMRRKYFRYEAWLQSASWRWYEPIALNYEPVAGGEFWMWWKRAGDWREPGPWEWTAEVAGRERVPLSPAEGGCMSVRTVELEYDVENPWRRVPVLGALPRFFVVIRSSREPTYVSLPPRERTFRFPVFSKPGESPVLEWMTASPVPGAKLVPRTVRVRSVPGSCQRVQGLLDAPDERGSAKRLCSGSSCGS